MINNFRNSIKEFPVRFWVLFIATFIDRLGGTMIFPFFALYVTQKFEVGMTQAGILLGIFSIFGFVGSLIGGALTDKIGRRAMVLFGLVISALSSLSMGFVNDLNVFYSLAVAVGFFSNIAHPARMAMVADLLPEEQHAEGYGMLRISGNLAWIIGPTIGGLLAATSWLSLFIMDAISSLITAVIVYRLLPETAPASGQSSKSILETLAGYKIIGKDTLFGAFILVSIFMSIVYQQQYNTLSVYLRDVHGISPQGYGFLLSLDAFSVVLFQFSITKRIKPYPPMLVMAAGTALYMVGFTMYGFVSIYALFIVAKLIVTMGEMFVMPVGTALVAKFAPSDIRGRYMAAYGLSWTIPASIGPWAGGLILDNYNPNWIWYISGVVASVAVIGFLLLHSITQERFAQTAEVEVVMGD